MKRVIILSLLLLLSAFGQPMYGESGQIDNIIVMIPDGLSIEGTTLVRWMNDGQPLAWDAYLCGLVRTYCADAPITDSAPAATAYATGNKSHSGFIATLPDRATMPGAGELAPERVRTPAMTILEAARLSGRSVGIVATSEVTHATPAAFTAHTPKRSLMNDIAEQQVYNGLDVVLGGGADFFESAKRPDKEDLWSVLKRLGVTVVRTPAEMKAVKQGPLWGIFDARALSCDKTRDPQIEPSLEEMTGKAIEILSGNPKGFFLMVEGSQIDWAGHGNDPVAYVADALAFNRAVKRALDFAQNDGRTVVIVVADHGTGGISMGSSTSNKGYDTRELEAFLKPLKSAEISAYELEKVILKLESEDEIHSQLRKRYGLDDITESEFQQVLTYCAEVRDGSRSKGKLDTVIGPMLSKRAAIGWTTTGHVGGDVALAVYHPQGDRPCGLVDNTELNRYMQRLFAVDLEQMTRRYFIEAAGAFASRDAFVAIDCTSNPHNPVMKVRKGRKSLLIPAFKNQVWLNGRQRTMPTVTVYADKRFYVSQDLIDLLD